MEIHIHCNDADPVTDSPLRRLIVNLTERVQAMSQTLQDLRAEVEAQRGVTQSAVTLIEGLAARIDELISTGQVNETALAELRDTLRTDRQALADAVARHDEDPTNDPGADTATGGEDTAPAGG